MRTVQNGQTVAHSAGLSSIQSRIIQPVQGRSSIDAAVQGAISVQSAIAVEGAGAIPVEITTADGGTVQGGGTDLITRSVDIGADIDIGAHVEAGAALSKADPEHGRGHGKDSDEFLQGEFLTKA